MREVKITVNIPDFIPSRKTIKLIWETIKYKMFPDRCTCCGTAIKFKYAKYENFNGNKRIMLSYDKLLCNKCLSDKITEYFHSVKTKTHECDYCGDLKETIQGTNCVHQYADTFELQTRLNLDRVCLGGMWWNGHNFCIDCITNLLEINDVESSHIVYFNKKPYSMNHKGALPKLF